MSRYLNLMVVSLMALFALACNDDSKGTDDSVDCETLSVNACSEHDECREISAALIDDKSECLLENEAVGCMAYDKTCPEAITLATDPEGALWYFGDQCIPAGWSMGTNSENEHLQNAETCSASTLDCTERSVSGCENDGKCALLEGRKVDEGDVCLEEKEPTGCDAKEPSCDDALTVARDKDETLWVFTSTCIPAGWSAETGEGYSQYANAELCDEDETPIDCGTLDVEACLNHDACVQINGSSIDDDLVCRHEAEPVGCMNVEATCGDMLTLAIAPDDSSWFFSNNCIPEGWETFSNDGYLDAPFCLDD